MAVQRDEVWLKSATPEEIAAADAAGELDELQGRVVLAGPEIGSVPDLQRDQAWVDAAGPERIAAAFAAGELDALLGKVPWPNGDQEKPAQGLYGDGTIRSHEPTARGDIPQASGPATTIAVGVDPKNSTTPQYPALG